MIFFLNTNFSLSFYKRTRSSSFIRTRSSWISRIFVRGGALTGVTHDVEHLILLNTNLTNNTNLFGMRIFLFFIRTRISHGFFTRYFFEHESHEIRRRPTDQREVITRIYLARGSFFFYTHTDLTNLTDLFAYGSS